VVAAPNQREFGNGLDGDKLFVVVALGGCYGGARASRPAAACAVSYHFIDTSCQGVWVQGSGDKGHPGPCSHVVAPLFLCRRLKDVVKNSVSR